MNPKTLYLAGLAAAVVALVGGIFAPVELVRAWHFAALGCLQPALGSLFLIMLYQSTGGRWGAKLMPAMMALRSLVPWCFLAFVPVLIFLPAVYPWAADQALAGDRSIYLNWPFFAGRAAIYLIVFGCMSLLLGRGKWLGPGGLIAFALICYFVAVDLVMALSPKWFSSGFPLVFMSSAAMMALSLAIIYQAAIADPAPADVKPWRDSGNMLLAMVVFWSYISFTQFLIIWAGNLPEEIGWYVARGNGIWKWVTIFMAVFNLFAPFFVLLSRWVKDKPARLQRVAGMVFVSQIVYTYWLVAPSFVGRGVGGMHWLDPLALVAALCPMLARLITIQRKEAARG